MHTKYLSNDFQIKALDDSGTFSGYGSVFSNTDGQGDIVIKGAFTKSLSAWQQKNQFPHLLWQHKMDEPIGHFTAMAEDQKGLYVEGKLLVDSDPVAKRAHAHMKAGSVRGLSIGYAIKDQEYNSKKGTTLLKELDLIEVSLVTRPANEAAQVEVVKHALSSPRNMERYLRDVGFSAKQAKRLMARGFQGVSRDDETLEKIKSLIQTIRG